MNLEVLAQHVAELKTIVYAIPHITWAHACELEQSLDMVWHALTDSPDALQEWTNLTLVVDKDLFANAGYDVSTLTKAELDEIADAMKDFWIAGKGLDQAIEYAAQGILERLTEDEDDCECCSVEGQFVLDQDGACARCRHEHTAHDGMREEAGNESAE